MLITSFAILVIGILLRYHFHLREVFTCLDCLAAVGSFRAFLGLGGSGDGGSEG